jgi:Uma2 family endonuclease
MSYVSRVLPDREVIVPASARSLAGFRAWAKSEGFPRRGRISFLDGDIYIDMTPEEIQTHGLLKAEIGSVLVVLNKKKDLGSFFPDGTLLTNVEANLSTEPDACFATWRSLEPRRVRLIPRKGAQDQYLELKGTPEWVLEIVSKTSVAKDTKRLRLQYHRAGISEYWLVDARREKLSFQILYRGAADFEPAPNRDGWQTSRVFGCRFRLIRQRGRMGLWQYTLEMKPSGRPTKREG